MEELSDAAEQVVEEKGDVAGRVRGDVREGLAEAVSGALGSDGSPDSSLLSRRSFMKTVAAGAVGLGAMALGPLASAFDVRSSDGLEVYETGTKYFDVQPGGPVQVTNTEFHVPDGSAASPSITFSNDTDTGIFRNAANVLAFSAGGSHQFQVINGAVNLRGGQIREVGSTTDAAAGAIRLANNNSISWRNAGDTADVNIQVNASDQFLVHNASLTNIRSDLDISGVGTSSASSGAIRLANASKVKARNAADSGNIQLLNVDVNDDVFISDTPANSTQIFGNSVIIDNGSLDMSDGTITNINSIDTADSSNLSLQVNGTEEARITASGISLVGGILENVGGTTAAQSGDIRARNNNTLLVARNNANSADVRLIGINTSDAVLIGDPSASEIVSSNNINFNDNEAQNMVLHQIAGDPATPVTGQIWYDTSAD